MTDNQHNDSQHETQYNDRHHFGRENNDTVNILCCVTIYPIVLSCRYAKYDNDNGHYAITTTANLNGDPPLHLLKYL